MMRRVVQGVLVLLLIASVALVVDQFDNHGHRAPKQIPNIQTAIAPPKVEAAPAKLSASYLVSGDVFWGRGIDDFAQRSALKYDWPFSRLNEFQPQNYNGWISDMECPVNDTNIPYQTQVDSLIFACSTKYLTAAAKYFTAMTIANNHTSNTGRSGFTATQNNLAAAGIQPFGDYDLSQIDNLCEVVAMPATVAGQAAKLPVAMCGYHWLSRQPTDAEVAQITKFAKYFPVWVFPHGGTEYDINFTVPQQALYHKFIDAGASVVFGDHPHVVEPTEAYHGKLIVYDLGNLIFDQWFDNEVTKSLIVNLNLSATLDPNLQKYLDMGPTCATFKDNCLETAQTGGLTAYKVQYSYKIIGGERSRATTNDRLTHPASDTTQQWLLGRTSWASTSAGLSSELY